jgi:hypothetical protein
MAEQILDEIFSGRLAARSLSTKRYPNYDHCVDQPTLRSRDGQPADG